MTPAQCFRGRKKLLDLVERRAQLRGAIRPADDLVHVINMFFSSLYAQEAYLYEIRRDRFDLEVANHHFQGRHAVRASRDYRRSRSLPIEWFPKPRSSGGYRKVCKFSDVDSMWHRMAADLIHAQLSPGAHIGDWRRRGRDRQVNALRSAMNHPQQCVVIADINHCFESLNFDAVYQLPYLPEGFVRKVLDHRQQTFRMRTEDTRHRYGRYLSMDECVIEEAPSGLMEGSPASNAIFSALMDDLPSHLDDRIQPFVYCDNIILLAPNLALAQQANVSLVQYLTGHRAGPFECSPVVQSVCRPFDHLGYQLRLEPSGRVNVTLSASNFLKLARKIEVENRDVLEVVRWLYSSFPQCSPQSMRSHVISIIEA